MRYAAPYTVQTESNVYHVMTRRKAGRLAVAAQTRNETPRIIDANGVDATRHCMGIALNT